jgi:hypothetical protein
MRPLKCHIHQNRPFHLSSLFTRSYTSTYLWQQMIEAFLLKFDKVLNPDLTSWRNTGKSQSRINITNWELVRRNINDPLLSSLTIDTTQCFIHASELSGFQHCKMAMPWSRKQRRCSATWRKRTMKQELIALLKVPLLRQHLLRWHLLHLHSALTSARRGSRVPSTSKFRRYRQWSMIPRQFSSMKCVDI